MTSSSVHRSGHDFRALVQDSLAAQGRRRPAARSKRESVHDQAAQLFTRGLAARLAIALREQLAGELAFCADISARLGRSWRLRREKPAPAQVTAPETAWAAQLAQEFTTQFEQAPAEPAAVDKPSRAAAVLRYAGLAAHGLGVVLWPVARFTYAQRNWVLKLAAIGLVLLAGAGVLQQWQDALPEPAASKPAAPRAAWLDIPKPYQLYELAAPQLAHEKLAYAARRHSAGGGREDSLTFGDFGAMKIFLRLSVYRHGGEKAADAPFFVDMVRRGAPLGLSIGSANVEQAQPTRFGDMQMAALTLSEGRATRENCRGFRLTQEQNDAQPGLTIAGLACAPAEETMSAAELGCLVNRLDLLAAGDDKPLRDFFGAAQARHIRGCAPGAHK